MILRARPLYRSTSASVGTGGTAFAIHGTSTQPVTTHQLVVFTSGLAFVGIGRESSPPTPTANNTSYQEAGESRVYTLDGNHNFEKYLYVYAETGTITVRISRFG